MKITINLIPWLRLVVSMILLSISQFGYGQSLPDFITNYKPVDGEKLTTIEYENFSYIVTGWVKKNTFVDGSPILISTKPSKNILNAPIRESAPVMEGIFNLEDGLPVITGEALGWLFERVSTDQSKALKSALSALSGMSQETTSQNSNDKYSELYGNLDGVVKGAFVVYNTDDKKLSAKKKAKFGNKSKDFAWKLKDVESIEKETYIPIDRKSLNGVFMQRPSGDGSGYEQWLDKIEWDGNPIASVKRTKIAPAPTPDVPRDSCWIVTFTNGDIYRGYLTGMGEMYLHTGEIIKSPYQTTISGLLTGEKHPTDYSWIIFKDGEEVGEYGKSWWDVISAGLTDEEKSDLLSRYTSPTQLRNSVRNLIAKKERAKKQKEEQRLAEQKRKRKEYVTKYGEKYGNAVADKRVIEGMSREMVCEFLPAEFFYTITKSGATETWRFSEQQVISALRMHPDGAQMLMAIQLVGGSVGNLVRTSNLFGVADVPMVIRFRNNKVSSITR